MSRKRPEDESNETPSPKPTGAGLFIRGAVTNRWRKTLDNGTEMVTYDIEGLTVTAYRPDSYLAIGQMVELEVTVSVWQARTGPRFGLVLRSPREGEF